MATRTPATAKTSKAADKPSGFNLGSAIDKVVPDKAKPSETKPSEAEQAALAQADKAAEVVDAAPKVRAPSKTHGVKPTHLYAGPRHGSTYIPSKEGRTIPRRDSLARRYLTLIAREEGADENICRRVNVDRGPTVGGHAKYTADSTGVPLVFTDGLYRVGQLDASGNVQVASDERREEVYGLCGGDEFLSLVLSQLGPDFTVGLAPKVKKAAAKKEAAKV